MNEDSTNRHRGHAFCIFAGSIGHMVYSSAPRNDGLVQMPIFLPRLLAPVVLIYVGTLGERNLRINDADFRRTRKDNVSPSRSDPSSWIGWSTPRKVRLVGGSPSGRVSESKAKL